MILDKLQFTKEEFEILLIDYEGFMKVTALMSTVVMENSKMREHLIDTDIIRMKILKKLRKFKVQSEFENNINSEGNCKLCGMLKDHIQEGHWAEVRHDKKL